VPGTVAHVLRDAEEQRKAALAHAQRCVVQLGIFDRTSRKLLDMGSGSLLEGGHILSAAHVFDQLTDPAHMVLVATFTGHLSRPVWSFTAELLTPLALLERGVLPGVRVDLAVARITGSITCNPPCFQGPASLAGCTYAIANGAPRPSAGFGEFVRGLACAGEDGVLPHLTCDRAFMATARAGPTSRVTVIGYPVAVGNHIHNDSADVFSMENGFLRTRAFIESASSGGPAVNGAGAIVGVVSYDSARVDAHRASFLRSVHLLRAAHGGLLLDPVLALHINRQGLPRDMFRRISSFSD
jgi:hypothetical protein